VESHFFPAPGRDTRTSFVELTPFTWFADVLYFPVPAAGLDGVMTLRLFGKGMPEPIEVRFRAWGQRAHGAAGAQDETFSQVVPPRGTSRRLLPSSVGAIVVPPILLVG